MKTIKATITKSNIDNAVKGNSHRCMIADAIQKQIPNAKYIMVDAQSIRYTNTKTGRRFIYLTPPEAQKALIKFDKGESVKPFLLSASQGHSRKMRVRQGKVKKESTRRNRTAKGQKAKRYMPKITREFGYRQITK